MHDQGTKNTPFPDACLATILKHITFESKGLNHYKYAIEDRMIVLRAMLCRQQLSTWAAHLRLS